MVIFWAMLTYAFLALELASLSCAREVVNMGVYIRKIFFRCNLVVFM
jgi:hypothetical protein